MCGMDVDVKKPRGGVWEHEGVRYYFCAPGCNRAFQKEPGEYLSGRKLAGTDGRRSAGVRSW